ncbi:MAG TPA: hypothetical protein VI873_01320 [Candidatus Peribacteraceae bacterium]|nr:hypothetical protein [Candidatus Peribacteraceae bacterium]
MNKRLFVATVGIVSGLLPILVRAAQLTIEKPSSFRDIEQVVTEKIPDDLEKAQCGGWDKEQSVEGKVAIVTGVPGRDADPLGNITSGMAKRIEDGPDRGFKFPEGEDETKGLSTACQPGQDRAIVQQWCGDGPAEKKCPFDTEHPYYEDPPCLWRAGWVEAPGPHNEQKCTEFCQWVNEPQFTFWDCKVAVPIIDPATGVELGWICVEDGFKYTCTQQWVNTPPGPEACNPNAPRFAGDMVNARNCRGEQCRSGAGVAARDPPYMSFYRKYETGNYRRDAVTTDKGRDQANNQFRAACYGLYFEFDPKLRVTNVSDQRCVLDIDIANYPKSQTGKGQYTVNKDNPMNLPEDPSKPMLRNPVFEKDKDLWYPNLGGGMSHLNPQVFEEQFKKDLSTALLSTDQAKENATRPLFDENKMIPDANLIRAFDDTVSNERGDKRTVVQWWQRFETDMERALTVPIVRLFLPPTWALGFDPLDPLLVGTVEREDPNDPTTGLRIDHRTKAIEVQLQAEEDLLGRVASFLERNLLMRIQEEPVPLVYPLGNATEFRAKKQAWITWRAMKKGPDGTANFPGEAEVDALILKLEEYAVNSEKVRYLRAELPKTIGKIISARAEGIDRIANWMEQNIAAYVDYLGRKNQLEILRGEWRKTQQTYVDFHDKTNMPWCKNDRFTLSVYSLLDPWMPQRFWHQRDLDSDEVDNCLANDGFPQLCPFEDAKDYVFDFSNLQFGAAKEPLKIPVLKPTLVRLEVPLPPGERADIKDPSQLKLPDYPEPPSIVSLIDAVPPPRLIEKDMPPVINVSDILPGPNLIGQWERANRNAREIIQGMNATYAQFWDSIRIFDEDWRNREGKQEAIKCQTKDGPVDLKPMECCDWATNNCVHVEMDLKERTQRIGARPMVLLKEDFDAKGKARELPECDPKDQVCETLLPEERSVKTGFQIVPPEAGDAEARDKQIEEIRKKVRESTLTPAAAVKDDIPYALEGTGTLLYPVFWVPNTVDLLPRSSSSSSSSSS